MCSMFVLFSKKNIFFIFIATSVVTSYSYQIPKLIESIFLKFSLGEL